MSRLLSVFMLILFLSYQASTTLFTHAHDIDGRVITHSHPYNSEAHSHSDAQVFALNHVSSFVGEDAIIIDFAFEAYVLISKIGYEIDADILPAVVLGSRGLRAPPFSC